MSQRRAKSGFTLIELSIVLVIIGLTVGGVLVGQSLIGAAAVRAQITQIEKFNTAANTFFGKYGYLPGDITAGAAAQFGFSARGPYAGQGDGNGLIEGNYNNCSGCNTGHCPSAGETAMFWVDLSSAGLIQGGFSAASSTSIPASTITATTSPTITAYLPDAKVGRGNYVYIWSGAGPGTFGTGFNAYGISAVTSLPPQADAVSVPGMTVKQAYDMDGKIDDGLPESGRVFAEYETTGGMTYPAGGGATGASGTPATPGSSITCYDNGNVAGATQLYSVEISNGSNLNCALSFKMQAGD